MTEHCDATTLSLYLDAELALPDRHQVSRHLRDCASCTTQLAQLRAADEALVRWGRLPLPLPPATEHRIQSAVERRRSRPRFALSQLVPAALGSTVAGLLVLVSANVGLLQVQQRLTTRLPLPQPPSSLSKQAHNARLPRAPVPLTINRVVVQDHGGNQPTLVD